MKRILVLVLAVFLGCRSSAHSEGKPDSSAHAKTEHGPPVASASASSDASSPSASASASAVHEPHAAPPSHPRAAGSAPHFDIPFVGDTVQEDPLSRVRGFLNNVLTDNTTYRHFHERAYFLKLTERQQPRATVIACADSRVQTTAIDATPENDMFYVRNIGNQIINSEGSIEYGVHHLKTAILLILGHTGCGAIKAAMGDTTQLPPAIRHEVEGIHVPKGKKDDPKDWLRAVVANIRNQVHFGLEKFEDEVQEGKLTVVGAVFDLLNDFGLGYARIVIIDVNGNSDPAKLAAFERAIGAPIAAEDRLRNSVFAALRELEARAGPRPSASAPPAKSAPSAETPHAPAPAPHH
ncbi:MAG: carbonic anhydrase [Myxococcales bacterium]